MKRLLLCLLIGVTSGLSARIVEPEKDHLRLRPSDLPEGARPKATNGPRSRRTIPCGSENEQTASDSRGVIRRVWIDENYEASAENHGRCLHAYVDADGDLIGVVHRPSPREISEQINLGENISEDAKLTVMTGEECGIVEGRATYSKYLFLGWPGLPFLHLGCDSSNDQFSRQMRHIRTFHRVTLRGKEDGMITRDTVALGGDMVAGASLTQIRAARLPDEARNTENPGDPTRPRDCG